MNPTSFSDQWLSEIEPDALIAFNKRARTTQPIVMAHHDAAMVVATNLLSRYSQYLLSDNKRWFEFNRLLVDALQTEWIGQYISSADILIMRYEYEKRRAFEAFEELEWLVRSRNLNEYNLRRDILIQEVPLLSKDDRFVFLDTVTVPQILDQEQ